MAPPTVNTAGDPSDAFSGVLLTVPEVQVRAIGTAAALSGTKFLLTVIAAGGAHPAKVMSSASVTVTSVLASARPSQLPLVMVMALPERTVPLKNESVIVAAGAVRQYTLHASAPPSMTTERPVPVRAPNPPVPTLKTQTSLADPLSVRVTAPVIVVPAAEQ